MKVLISSMVALLTVVTCATADSIDREARTGAVMKMLREMVNQTKADTLNLPANATSIRENITDTFSCENRTYGYYADVDNECQIFHVCLTSQGASGRNTTYKWSFICPQETVFNQEVLVCTRPRESIPCEDSPDYYDLNMEIGKVVTDSETDKTETDNQNVTPPNKNAERIPVKNQKKPLNRKKQNIIIEELMKEAMEEMEVINEDIIESQNSEDIEVEKENNEENVVSLDKIILDDKNMDISNGMPIVMKDESIPVVIEASESEPKQPAVADFDEADEAMINTRLASERSLKRKGRKYRGSIKFRSDIQ